MDSDAPLSDDDYRALAEFRAGLRRFLHFSEDAARKVGLTPQQHQLLVVLRGHVGDVPPTIGEIAEALQTKHHSTVGLIDRMVEAGLVTRSISAADNRRVNVLIAPEGERLLAELAAAHREEYRQLDRLLRRLVERFGAA